MYKISSFLLILGCFLRLTEARTCVCSGPLRGGDVTVKSCTTSSCGNLGSINPGACFDYQGTQGTWYKINYNGKTGYAPKASLSAPHTCRDSGQQCVARLCSAFSTNEKRACDRQGCGNYGASRGRRKHDGWDIKCSKDAAVYAPFDGVVKREARPYKKDACMNTGFLIEGTGQYTGHAVKIFYARPTVRMPATVTRGQAVAKHVGFTCDSSVPGITDHIHYQLEYNGANIDPASYIFC